VQKSPPPRAPLPQGRGPRQRPLAPGPWFSTSHAARQSCCLSPWPARADLR